MFDRHIMRVVILSVLFITVSAQYRHGDIRLVGGSIPNEGRVEIYVNGEWGTVCDDHWGKKDATVVCRQLGYRTSDTKQYKNASFGEGVGEIALDNVNCTSNETFLLDCPHNELFVHNCDHSEDAGVRCNASDRLNNIIANVITTSLTSYSIVSTVSISWELQNAEMDEPSMFSVECFNKKHKITPLNLLSNQTYTTELVGFLPSTRYNCCVSALYGLYATRTICTLIDIPEIVTSQTDITSESLPMSDTSESMANTVGGVLGCVIIILMVLLALLGAALIYLLVLLRHTREAENVPRNAETTTRISESAESQFVDVNLTIQNNPSYVAIQPQSTSSGTTTQIISHSGASY